MSIREIEVKTIIIHQIPITGKKFKTASAPEHLEQLRLFCEGIK